MTPKGARTAKGAATRRRIVDSASDLFHEQGINATTVGDVLRRSEVGKGQFYRHFESREQLIVDVLRAHRDMLATQPAIASWADLEQWLSRFPAAQREFDFRRGCPVGTAAYALQPAQADARHVLEDVFDSMRRNIAGFLAAEQQAGRYDTAADPSALAQLTVAAVQGGTLLGLVDGADTAATAVAAETLAHLRSHVARSGSPE